MPNPTRKRADIALIEQLCAVGDGVIGTEEKAILAQSLRAKDPETSQALDHALFGRIETQADALCQARDTIEKQHALLKKHTSAPWIPATFLGAIPIGEGQRALVATGNSRRLVEVVDGIKTDELGFGEDVFLGEQGNVIMGRATLPTFGGEIATLERHLPDGRQMCPISLR